MKSLPSYNEALRIFTANLSMRAQALRSLERYVDGTQYEALADFFSDKKPLWERAPCIVYPIVKSAIDSNADLLLGDDRFPDVSASGLTGDASTSFEKAICALIQQSRLKTAAREVFSAAQGCGSACAVFGVRGGRLFIDTVKASWCEPTLNPDGSVVSLSIQYPFLTIVKVGGEQKVVCKLYRREIDAQSDTTYLVATAREDGLAPKWQPDPDRTVQHGLGFCPVVWYPHLQGCAAVDDYDGRALHEHLTDEIRALDFALSQRHRAALYCGDPQWTEIGVDAGYNPTGTGRAAHVPASKLGRPGEVSTGAYVSGPPSASKARKKSPGTVWQYTGSKDKVQVQLHTLPGDALVALDNHAKDLRTKIAESLGVVFMDVESLPNESRLSGKALESFKAPQLDKVDGYRLDFGDRFLLPALGMLIRIVDKSGIKIEGFDQIQAVISKSPQWSWQAPAFDFIWGDYFRPNGTEEELIIRGAVEAKEGGLATTKVLVTKLRSILGIKDVDSYLGELAKEKADAVKEAQDAMKAQAALMPAPAAAPKAGPPGAKPAPTKPNTPPAAPKAK